MKEFDSKNSVVIERLFDNAVNTIGRGTLFLNNLPMMNFCTLELAYLSNKKQVSAIPNGSYLIHAFNHPKFGDIWKVTEQDGNDVKERKGILIHPANYASSNPNYKTELKGCIAFGFAIGDLNKDGIADLLYSQLAHKVFNSLIKLKTLNLLIK
jgi:hypothetical protein